MRGVVPKLLVLEPFFMTHPAHHADNDSPQRFSISGTIVLEYQGFVNDFRLFHERLSAQNLASGSQKVNGSLPNHIPQRFKASRFTKFDGGADSAANGKTEQTSA